jgi:hypothetical protein
MTLRQLDRLLIAPEIIVVDLVDAALIALECALRVEHPLIDAPPPTEHPPIRRHGRLVIRHAQRLRAACAPTGPSSRPILREAEAEDSLF